MSKPSTNRTKPNQTQSNETESGDLSTKPNQTAAHHTTLHHPTPLKTKSPNQTKPTTASYPLSPGVSSEPATKRYDLLLAASSATNAVACSMNRRPLSPKTEGLRRWWRRGPRVLQSSSPPVLQSVCASCGGCSNTSALRLDSIQTPADIATTNQRFTLEPTNNSRTELLTIKLVDSGFSHNYTRNYRLNASGIRSWNYGQF